MPRRASSTTTRIERGGRRAEEAEEEEPNERYGGVWTPARAMPSIALQTGQPGRNYLGLTGLEIIPNYT